MASTVLLISCGNRPGALDPASMLSFDPVIGQPGSAPSGEIPLGNAIGPRDPIGDSCQSDPTRPICLAIKYVSYVSPRGEAVVSQSEAMSNVRGINDAWSGCGIGFQIEQYVAVRPEEHGLRFHTGTFEELERIRSRLGDSTELLIVSTGIWDRNDELGKGQANAWTSMPGGGSYGAVIEETVSSFPNLIAHELGHYLSLMHSTDQHDLMHPIIYSDSNAISRDQCASARQAAAFFWRRMYR